MSGPFALAPTAATPAADVAAVKRVIEAARKGKEADANAAEASITDPVARKLAEWVILRSDNTNPTFQRYAAFVEANPSWPHAPLFRRRAENALWNDGVDDRTRSRLLCQAAAVNRQRPFHAGAHLARPRRPRRRGGSGAPCLAQRRMQRRGRETSVLEMFGDMLTAADHKARMEHRFYADDVAAGMRAAERLGGNELAIARGARSGLATRPRNAKALLDAVPASAQRDARLYFRARAMAARRTTRRKKPEN